MSIESIKGLYDNRRTYENTRTRLKRVNTLLRLTPIDVIHTEEYVRQFATMAHLLMTETGVKGGVLKSKDELTSYIGSVVGAVSRTLASKGSTNPLTQLLAKLKLTDIPNPKPVFDAAPWSDVYNKLHDASINCPNKFGRIVSICFKHGYVLRVGEIYNTSTTPIDGMNYLDLTNHEWNITIHKNVSRGSRKFTITKEFVDELTPLLSPHCPLLIHKSTLMPYTVQTLAVLDLNDLPSNSQMRNSYEEWNWSESGRSREEQIYWSVNVLGHSENTVMSYYTSNKVESELQALAVPLSQQIANRKQGDPKIKVVVRKRV